MTEKPAILMIGNFLSGSLGTRGVCEDLAERLCAAGWDVRTASNKVGRLARLADMLSTAWRDRSCYRIATIDTYSGNAFILAEALGAFLKFIRKPFILILHGGNLPDFARKNPRRVARLLGWAAAITAPSRYLQEQLSAFSAGIRHIPNPIDLSDFSYHPRQPVQPRLLWLRAFHQIYNPSLAVKVAARLAPSFPDLRLTMVGPDKGDGSLLAAQKLTDELGMRDVVRFTGGVPHTQVPEWLEMNDIFLNTTQIDNTPVSLLEALASGCCLVSTKVGGIPYLLQDGENALLVSPDDAEAMAECVTRILKDDELAQVLSRNGRLKAEQFDWMNVLPQWDELLHEVSR